MSRRAEEIAALLAYRESEGLTYAELANEPGLAKSTLAWWSWRLRRDAKQGFAQVLVADVDRVPADDEQRISIVAGELTVTVPRDFDDDTLARVLLVVSRQC